MPYFTSRTLADIHPRGLGPGEADTCETLGAVLGVARSIATCLGSVADAVLRDLGAVAGTVC